MSTMASAQIDIDPSLNKNGSPTISIIWRCGTAIYDSLGNVYRSQIRFDHIPDRQDSLSFEVKCNEANKELIKKIHEENRQHQLADGAAYAPLLQKMKNEWLLLLLKISY